MTLLPDLERGPTWTEAFRAQCEARMVARMARPERLAYYEAVAKRRGMEAADALSEGARAAAKQIFQD